MTFFSRISFIGGLLMRALALVPLAALVLPIGALRAAEFPSGPIRWVIPYPSGGAYDTLSRGLAPVLSKRLGVPVVVNIVPGPDGYNQIINAKPDGHTIGMSEPLSVYATALLSKPAYNVEDLTWLGRINASANLIVASKKSGITSFEQLKAHKGPVRGAAFGVTTPILQQIVLAETVKFQLAPVNFRTIGELIVGTVRGDADIAILGPTPWLKHIEAKNVVPILVWDTERNPLLPDVPSLRDIGHPELVPLMNHRGVVVPPNLPGAVTQKLIEVFKETIASGEGRAFLEKARFETNDMWGEEFRQAVAATRKALHDHEAAIRRLATQ
jgi:tripartite-type tricarboxylate transporter receptor subunit TctC